MMSEAGKVLEQAEARDGYKAACAASAPNAYARAKHSYTPFFIPAEDAARLQAEVDRVDLLRGTDIVVAHPTTDEGYPHTRAGSVVVMPAGAITDTSTAELAETLRHESMHIDQRRRPTIWAAACMRRGWWPLPASQIPQRHRDRCRINPDTMSPQPFWAWESHHVPLPLFTSETPSSLGDVHVKWLDLRNGTLYADPPASFSEKYGINPSQPEHPYELIAVMAAAKGIVDIGALDTYLRSQE
jgi:hypothetical protein